MRKTSYKLLLTLLLYLPAGAQAQKVESGFTVWTNLDDLQWVGTLGRKALLVGNGAYNEDPQNPPPGVLGNLGAPCGDVRLVAKSLVDAGWKPSEVAVACNQKSEQLDRALARLISALPRGDGVKPLTFIYLAGHGAQTDQRNYFFGVKVAPDMDRAIDQALRSDGGELFGGSATNVVATFANQLGTRSPSPVLLVLDACRNDALFDRIQSRLMDKARSTPTVNSRDIAAEALGFLTAPQGIVPPRGIRILYATSKGARVPDDNGRDGHSWLAVALDDAIRRQNKAERVVGDVIDEVGQATERLQPPERRQFPDVTGFLRNDPCIRNCPTIDNVASYFPLRPRTPRMQFASLTTTFRPQSDAEIETKRESVSLLKSDLTDPRKATVEIFWCAGVPQQERNQEAAMTLGHDIESSTRLRKTGFEDLVRLRVTPLDPYENAEPGRQINQDVIVLDPIALSLGRTLLAIDAGLTLNEVSSAGPRYVAVYYCKESYSGSIAPMIYIQSPPAGITAGTSIIRRLERTHPAFDTVNFVDTKPPFFPSRTEVRYFSRAQKEAAIAVAKEVEASTGIRPRLNGNSAPPSAHNSKLIEVWLSNKDAPNASTFVRADMNNNRQSLKVEQ